MHVLTNDDIRFFSGSSHPKLAKEIASYLSVPLSETHISRFSNDNLFIQLGASARGRVVYLIQSFVPPVSDHVLELLMMVDIAYHAGAREIHAIIPYYSYARSDKKDAPRISITARLIADLLVTAGTTHIMTMTLHSPQVHGFFSVPTDPLTARHLFVRYYENQLLDPRETVVVSPDIGRAKSAARFAAMLGLPAASSQKERLSDHEVLVNETIERQVSGFQQAIIYDDEIATGTTILELSKLLVNFGIQKINVICTHGVFTGNALRDIDDFPEINEVLTTNTVPIPKEKRISKLRVISVAPIFGEAIWRNYTRRSIGDLFSFGHENKE